MRIFYVALGGAIGATGRYLISLYMTKTTDAIFPVGTVTVNLIGCFIIGLIWSLGDRFLIGHNVCLFLFIGILGAFTTFSTFMLESLALIQDGDIVRGVMNIVISNTAGFCLVFF